MPDKASFRQDSLAAPVDFDSVALQCGVDSDDLPSVPASPATPVSDILDAFRKAMADAGIIYDGEISGDSELHHIKANGDHHKNGWYILHTDKLPAGAFGHYKLGVDTVRWCAKPDDQLTRKERAELKRQMAEAKRKREEDQARQQAQARIQAQAVLDAAQPASEHAYLTSKAVQSYPGVKQGSWPQRNAQDCLLIPFSTLDGVLTTVQAIAGQGPELAKLSCAAICVFSNIRLPVVAG